MAMYVTEIFHSLQGETTRAGLPCTFVRTAGCNLHCAWCDTEYARTGPGEPTPLARVRDAVLALGTRLVCITGGEPLLQAEAVGALSTALLAAGRTVLLETNGSLDMSAVPAGVVRIMDVKCPGSGECGTTRADNVAALRAVDEAKFVLADRADFDWAVDFVRGHGLEHGPQVLFSAVQGRLEPRDLAAWILKAGLEVRLQVQLHKLLWPGRDRGV